MGTTNNQLQEMEDSIDPLVSRKQEPPDHDTKTTEVQSFEIAEDNASDITRSTRGNIFKGTLPQLVAVLAGTLTGISDGMQYGWTAPVLPILLGPNPPFSVTKLQAEWLETTLLLGSVLGLWVTMLIVNRIGRKRSMLLAAFVSAVVWITIATASRVEYVFVARAFAGAAGNMAFIATPMYTAEIADQKIRGFLSSLVYIMILVGVIIIYCVAPYIPFYAHCLLGAALATAELCIFPFFPESPYYLLFRDKPVDAENALRRLRPAGTDITKELEEIKIAIARQKASEKGRIQDLFLAPSSRKATIIMMVLNTAQHFSSFSVLLMNMHVILEAAGSIYVDPRIAAILFSIIMCLAATTASLMVDKFGRKKLLITSSIFTGFCLVVLASYFSVKNSGYDTARASWIPTVCVMVYACTFKLGLGIVPSVLTAELFSTKMKAYGMTLVDGFYNIASFASIQLYQRLFDSFGLQYPFFIFSVSCFMSAIFTYYFIPETKGRTLDQIQLILQGPNNRKKKENSTQKTDVLI